MEEPIVKTSMAPPPGDDPLEFVMSDDSVDRMGDIIDQAGWQLANFRRNPIALFGHQQTFVVGNWTNVRVVGNQLRGHLDLLPPVSERLQEIHAAAKAGVLRAVSVGFRPLPGSVEPIEGSKVGGVRFLKSELVECSLVAVPANANALSIAKELNLSGETRSLIFGKTASEDHVNRAGPTGKPALNSSVSRPTKMTLSEKIEAALSRLNSLKDQLTDHINKQTDDVMDEQAMTVADELNLRIAGEQRQLDMLKAAEATLGQRSDPVVTTAVVPTGPGRARPFALPKKDIKPGDYVYRSLTAMYLSHVRKKSIQEVLCREYGSDDNSNDIAYATHRVAEWTVLRAASVPATTTLTGWAAELVQTSVQDFLATLTPMAVYPRLSSLGQRFTFGRNGVISVPSESATPTIAGAFVAEGAAIPVKQGAFTSITLTPKKMGVISTFTRQIAQHSTPAIEQIIRGKMQRDTALSIDTVLLDATAASAIRPAGLRNGVSALTATAGANFVALVADLKQALGVLVAANSLRTPVWIMNPLDAMSIGLQQNAGGDFPFKQEVNSGTFQGYPMILSTTQTLHTVLLLDAADFVSVTGDEPQFDISDQATLHMEDTAPQAIGLSGSATVPIRSMFQTDSIALRMQIDMNWSMLRTGVTTYIPSITW